MDNPIPVDLGRVAQDLQIRRVQVESVVQLLDEGNTVPFITRYRKERTGNLNEVVIGEIQSRVHRLRELAERKETILKAIEAQGKLSPELAAAIRSAENPKRLEDLYLPFKPKKRTKASDAREKGLEPLAARVWNRDEALTDLTAAAQEFVNAEKGLETPEKVLEGVGHILAEAISEMAAVRDAVRKVVWKTGKISTSKGEVPEGQGLEYRDYFNYSEPLAQVPPHRVLAINRGDKEGPLKIKIEVPRTELEAAFFHQIPLEGHPQADCFRTAAIDALDRLILPSMEREVRRDLTDAAERHAVEVFARNLRSLLLQPPIPKQTVLAVDPGLRSGCKIAVLDENGNLLEHTIIYPHAPQNRRSEAKLVLKDLVGKHRIGVVAIGNGTACRETEELIAEIIAEGTRFTQEGAVPANGSAATAALASEHPASEHPTASPAESPAPVETPPTPVELAAAAVEPSPGPLHPAGAHSEAQPESEASLEPGPPAETTAQEAAPQPAEHENPMPVAGLTEETLPPITGGAPEPSSPEAEAGPAAPGGDEPGHSSLHGHDHQGFDAQTPAEHGHVAQPDQVSVPDGEAIRPAAAEARSNPAAGEPATPDAAATAGTADSTNADIAASAEPGNAGGSLPAGDASPSQGPQAAVPEEAGEATPEAPQPSSAAAGEAAPAAAEGATAAQPSAPVKGAQQPAKPAQEGRRGGSGRGDHGRNRGPRPKQPIQPPPPQTPPAPHAADAVLAQLAYVIVNEAGASVYSASPVGREELPDYDATLRSAISIGRRLQDPLAELVKIEPQNIGVGLYQHDVNPKQLRETLDSVISSCVNFVGVDLNTASVPLLRHVSGLNQLTARRLVDRRKEKGGFAGREQLIEIDGIGPVVYTQAAGFLKIPEAANPLDRTWVHPESYEAATRLLARFDATPDVVRDKEKLPELRQKLAGCNLPEVAKELGIGELTLHDIIEALGRPERDPREDLPKPIFKKGILKLEDLTAGMELLGTVLNVVDFGAFVDIGLKDSGLVHISQLANRYIKSPHDVVSVGDVVTVWVMSVDHERKRVSLTMVKPGTERQRQSGGGGRRGPGGGEAKEGQGGQGPGRRDRPRGPRPSGSALTSPPVGAAPITALDEHPPRRPERDRGPSQGAPGHGEGGGPHGPGPGRGPGPGGPRGDRGGPRGAHGPGGPGGRPGSGRFERPQGSRPPDRPSRPSPPPPPLSKEALTGNVPLRTFGQLKQLWEARSDSPDDQKPPGESPMRPAPDAETASQPPSSPSAPLEPPAAGAQAPPTEEPSNP
jgi:uncharacterized protein